jgi:hypothetical protein
VVGVCIKVVSKDYFVYIQQEKEERGLGTMPPRRHIDRPMINATMEEEMRQLCARLDSMEIMQRRAPNAGDINESENEDVEAK